MRRLISSFGQHRILGGAAVLAFTQVLSAIVGLLRDRILAGTFPQLGIVDIYIASFRPSDLLFQVTVMAGFSVALVPMLSGYKAKGDRKGMESLLSSAVTMAAFVFGGIAVVTALFFDHLAPLLVSFDGDALQLYITFGRMALLSNVLFVFGNAFGQYLITEQRYWLYGLSPIFYSLGTIGGTIFLTPAIGSYGPMMGTIVGAILYVLIRLFGVVRSGCFPRLALGHTDMPEMWGLMLPRMLAVGALQLQLLFFDRIASGLDVGSVTINAYARNFQGVAVGLAGVALAQSAFSLLSQAAAKGESSRFWIYLRKGTLILLAITIPGAVALVLLTPVAASLVNLSHMLPAFGVCLLLYSISIPFESMNHLLLRSFYALKHTVTPAILSVLNGTIAITVSWKLSPVYGVYSLAVGFTAGQIVQLVGLGVLLPRFVRQLK